MELSWTLKIVGLVAILGLAAGMTSSLLGIGAGIIVVPVLSLAWDKVYESPQKLAQGTALAVMVPMALAGALRYHFGADVEDWRTAIPIALYALVASAVIIGVPLLFARHIGCTDFLGHVSWKTAATMSIGAVVGSVWLGAPLANALPTDTLRAVFGVSVIVVGIRMLGWHMFIISLLNRVGAA